MSLVLASILSASLRAQAAWTDHRGVHKVECRIASPDRRQFLSEVASVKRGHRVAGRNYSTDGPAFGPASCAVYRTASHLTVCIFTYRVMDWAKAEIWVLSNKWMGPIVFKYRDEVANVVSPVFSGKSLKALSTYDRWIGGSSGTQFFKGQALSRCEEVTTYDVTSRGLRLASRYLRIVPNLGGGVHERFYKKPLRRDSAPSRCGL